MPGQCSFRRTQAVLVKSQLPFDVLANIWGLADIDNDGALDADEFAVAMHLCHKCMQGEALPKVLTPSLLPPSKRNPLLYGKPADAMSAAAAAPANPT